MHHWSFCFILSACLFSLSNGADYKVNINPIIRELMPAIRDIIKKSGFDPMEIPDVRDYVTPAYMNLTEGVMQGGVGMKVKGKFNIIYSGTRARMLAPIFFEELKGKFNYSVRSFGFYSDSGIMEATIKDVVVGVRIDYIMDKLVVRNPYIKIFNYKDVKISMESSSYINWLKNLIVNTAIPFYKGEIIRIAEETALKIVEKNIKKANNLLANAKKDPMIMTILTFLDGLRQQSIQQKNFSSIG